MPQFEVPEVDYSRYSNRQLMGPPVAMVVLAVLVIAAVYAMTGNPVGLGTEFTGGTELRVVAPGDADVTEPFSETVEGVQPVQQSADTFILTFGPDANSETIRNEALDAGYDVISVQSTSPSFASSTQRLALYGVVIAFVGMSIVVFGLFRTAIPSGAVVFSAFGDIAVPVALMNLLGIDLSLGTVAALLMLIGYSVDSDILLTNHVLRRSGGFYESVRRAMRTGVTMTLTSIAAMAVMALVATFYRIDLMSAIGTVLVFGLTTDLIITYMFNVSLLRWFKFEGVNQ